MLSPYAEFQFYAYMYVVVLAMIGYAISPLTNQLLNIFFPPLNGDNVPLFPVPPPQPHPPAWEHVGWYRTGDKQYAPLFHLPNTRHWFYPLRDGFVHPKEAAVRRRGIPLFQEESDT